ncbi:hypothetical protein AJ79_00252 [Helicocarpus griseus UAMH5409]|uniref:Chromo domain-containing protein n=1 Tax=Helicocarpus griseus UAMH5409 TaxID=1447875 RepID=A0A2B7YCM7_9EURO|nr:hypothetical protein AJ79_00252 [Helicocarpus griseus UAMH5409]
MDNAAASDDDSISITSTRCSTPRDEYDVETILARKDDPEAGKLYLVKWTGYPLERATWEPREHFTNPNDLVGWREKLASSDYASLDVNALLSRIDNIEIARFNRHLRRRAKRIRMGLPVSPSPSPSGGDGGSKDSGSDLDGFVVGDDVNLEDENEEVSWKLLRKKRQHTTINTKPTTESPASQSRKIPSKLNRSQSASAAKTLGYDGRPKPLRQRSSPTKKAHAPKNILEDSSLYKARPILRLQTSTSTGPSTSSLTLPSQTSIPKGPAKDRHSVSLPTSKSLASTARSGLASFRAKKRDTSKPRYFRNLSLRNKYEKAMRRELTPDIRQLDLRPPGEWLGAHRNKPAVTESPTHMYDSTESLFVEQDSPNHDSSNRYSLNSPTTVDGSGDGRNGHTSSRTQHMQTKPLPALSSTAPIESSTLSANKDETAKPPQRRFWSHGRFSEQNEALVSLRFGPEGEKIGDARLGGLLPKTIWQLVSTKVNNQIDILFKDVCNLDEYRQLCEKRQNLMYSSSWVIGFSDTSSAINRMADYLRDNNLAALWYHPDKDKETSTVIVAFSSESPEWSWLNWTPTEHRDAKLRIAVRSSLNSVSSLPRSVQRAPPSYNNEHHGILTGPEDTSAPMDIDMPQPSIHVSTVTPATKPLPVISGPVDIVSIFREQFGITYHELGVVGSIKKDRSVRSFYLHFPSEMEDEYQLVMLFLKQYDAVAFSNRVEGDWQKFVGTATNGTVLFHQRFIHYEDMPGLAKLLRNPINVFNISLAQPINYLDYKTHLERLFPHGCIILMTEDFMLKRTKDALEVLSWFASHLDRKFPGTRKMFFRPNVQGWLLDLSATWPDDKLWRMYCLIDALIPEYPLGHYNTYRREGSPDSLDGLTDDEGQHHPFISTREIPDYGSRREDDHPNIPKGLTQTERDTDHLVEYFAGYALMNADKFRRFVVLTTHKPQPRWQAWSHIEVMDYPEFQKEFMISSHSSSSSNIRRPSSSSSRPQPHSERRSISGPSSSRPREPRVEGGPTTRQPNAPLAERVTTPTATSTTPTL